MTSGGKSHHSKTIGINAESAGIVANQLDATLHVLQHIGITVSAAYISVVPDKCVDACNAIFEHECGNSVAAEPFRDTGSFRFTVKPEIASLQGTLCMLYYCFPGCKVWC